MNPEKTKNIIIFSIIAVSLSLIYQNQIRRVVKESVTEVVAKQEPLKENKEVNYFENIQIEAKSGYVLDVSKNKILFSKQASEQLPLASITKVMTAIIAQEIYGSGTSAVTANKFNSLMTAMLIESSNGAATTISKELSKDSAKNFIGLMNKKAGELGLAQTIFSNPTGLDLSEADAGAYGSAQDAAKLLVYGYQKYPDVFEVTRYPEVEIDGKKIFNKNELAGKIPNIIAGKTGLTNLAGGNLALLVGEGDNLFAIVVLGSSEKGRFSDCEQLITATALYMQNR